MNLTQRLTNALYAQAVVDAVGNPFEFRTRINPEDVVAYANSTKSLVISDDTQMAMFGFEAIENTKLWVGDFESILELNFSESYVNWYVTQIQSFNPHLTNSGLLGYRAMYSVQSPGNTCLDACSALKYSLSVRNDSKGCGSVMRLLPLVMLYDENYELSHDQIVDIAKMTGRVTHLHAENDVAIEYYMNAVQMILEGVAFTSEHDHITDISKIGEGWTALEAVQMAIWAYCKAKDFDDLLKLSIAHNGDSDSVGAIAGSLWGLSGREVPQKYIDKLDALVPIKYVIDSIIKK